MRRLATPALLLLLPLAVFLALFHPATLDIGNAGWLIRGTDNGENALGVHAWLHEQTVQASPRTTMLNAPEGVALLFTDSNPLVAIAIKQFAALLPADAQFVGLWILLCLILNVLFSWLLLRRFAPGSLALWAGVVLLAFPPTLIHRYGHANLMAHWTILAALWLFLDPVRGRRLRWWAPLIAVTALVHSYLLVMVGAVWASAMLARLVDGPARARRAVLGQGVAVLALVALLAWWLGVGGQASSGYYGAFSMPLDALWNPSSDHISRFLPGWERSPGRGFEGFQFMGAGGLLLVLLAIGAAWRLPARDGEMAAGQRLRSLAPALVVLTILAVMRPPLPDLVLVALDPVRASGRLFWPVGYVLVFMALLAVYRLSAARAGFALAALVAIQAVDLSGMAAAVRAESAEAGHGRLYVRTLDPRWGQLVARSRTVAFMAGDVTQDFTLFQEVAWRAVKAGRPVTSVYAARTSAATGRRLAREEAAFARGELVPDRLYVMLPGTVPPAAAAGRALTLDGVTVVGPR